MNGATAGSTYHAVAQDQDTHQSPDTTASSVDISSDKPRLTISAERKRIGKRLIIPTLILVLASAGLATFLLLWITVIHGVPAIPEKSLSSGILQSGAFLVEEGSGRNKDGTVTARLLVLTISTITVCNLLVLNKFERI